MTPNVPLHWRFRAWLAGLLFFAAGRLHPNYDVWLDDAPPRRRREASDR